MLSGWPSLEVELVDGTPSEPGSRQYRFSSRTTRDTWIVEVRTVIADRSVRIEFGREGKPWQGWVQYDLEPGVPGTSVRSTGEFRISRLLGAVNALLGRHLDNPDRDLNPRVQHWLAAKPDTSDEPGDINEH